MNATTAPHLEQMIEQLQTIQAYGAKLEQRFNLEISQAHPSFRQSLRNLLHYLALRHHDIQDLQKQLGRMGISRLGKAESHVIASMVAIQNILLRIQGSTNLLEEENCVSFDQGKALLEEHAEQSFGAKPSHRRARIMVTFPSEAAEDYELVLGLLKAGMNCARLNCAHDSPEAWGKMIQNLQKAMQETGKHCKVCMDLGGPKIRTGAMKAGPKVIHLSPQRDPLGNIIGTYRVWLAPEEQTPPTETDAHIPLAQDLLAKAKTGDEIRFQDSRGKKRTLQLLAQEENGYWAESDDNAYILTGLPVSLCRKDEEIAQGEIGELPPIQQHILLNVGDQFRIHKAELPGEPAQYDEQGNLLALAHTCCDLPSLYTDLRPGEKVLFDDGKIESVVKTVSDEEIVVEITYAKVGGAKLKAEKGINLPDSNLRLSGLTEKDKEDLKFVVKHADVINMSFVNSPQDVEDLLQVIQNLGASPEKIGIVLKIETQKGVTNLPSILLKAMQWAPLGVMIARGDLAVECGWRNLAEVQEEILRICEAAHVPIIWATQVLESVAKKGRPSRAEITDAAMSQRAECVMLNKGPYILEAISMLDEILHSMQMHQDKKAPMLPTLKIPDHLVGE